MNTYIESKRHPNGTGRAGSPGLSVFSCLSPCATNSDKYQLIECYGPVELDMFIQTRILWLKILKTNNQKIVPQRDSCDTTEELKGLESTDQGDLKKEKGKQIFKNTIPVIAVT